VQYGTDGTGESFPTTRRGRRARRERQTLNGTLGTPQNGPRSTSESR
jgi:hypothetical protein